MRRVATDCCSKCGARQNVYRTTRTTRFVFRYLKCQGCGSNAKLVRAIAYQMSVFFQSSSKGDVVKFGQAEARGIEGTVENRQNPSGGPGPDKVHKKPTLT